MERESTGGAPRVPGCEHDVAAVLKAEGLRPTKARCQLLAYLRSTDRHPSVEEITSTLRSEGAEIGVATVYQNLNKLVDAGLVRRFSGPDGRSRFDGDLAAHSHAVCESCGRVVDLELDTGTRRVIDRVSTTDTPLSQWLVTGTSVEVRGLCPGCRRH